MAATIVGLGVCIVTVAAAGTPRGVGLALVTTLLLCVKTRFN
jgi:hypothetical protein